MANLVLDQIKSCKAAVCILEKKEYNEKERERGIFSPPDLSPNLLAFTFYS